MTHRRSPTPEDIKSEIFADNLMHRILTSNKISWEYVHSKSHLNQQHFNNVTSAYLQTLVKTEKSTAFIRLVDGRSTRAESVKIFETFKQNYQPKKDTDVGVVTFCQDIALLAVFIWFLKISEEKTAEKFCNEEVMKAAHKRIVSVAKTAILQGRTIPVENAVVRDAVIHAANAANA